MIIAWQAILPARMASNMEHPLFVIAGFATAKSADLAIFSTLKLARNTKLHSN
jgi:hypothetical protein